MYKLFPCKTAYYAKRQKNFHNFSEKFASGAGTGTGTVTSKVGTGTGTKTFSKVGTGTGTVKNSYGSTTLFAIILIIFCQ
jgi:hypothetical protein